MSIVTAITDAQAAADADAVLAHVLQKMPLDPEVYRRVHERAAKVTEEIRRKYGVVNIAVDLIRSARDEG